MKISLEKALSFVKWLIIETIWYIFGLIGLICVAVGSFAAATYLFFEGVPW